jgi:hypothetical protein
MIDTVTPAFLAPNKSPVKSRVHFKILSAELDRLPGIPIIFTLSPFLGARAANPAGTARHHSGHCRSPRAAPVPLSAALPGIPGLPRSRRPARHAITAVLEITPAPENPENSTKISLPLFPNFS